VLLAARPWPAPVSLQFAEALVTKRKGGPRRAIVGVQRTRPTRRGTLRGSAHHSFITGPGSGFDLDQLQSASSQPVGLRVIPELKNLLGLTTEADGSFHISMPQYRS